MGTVSFLRRIRIPPTFRNLLLIIIGTALLAFGTGVFLIPFELVTGGVSGIGIILRRALGGIYPFSLISAGLYASVLNVLLFLVGLIFLGRPFAVKTLLSVAVYPVVLYFSSRLADGRLLGGFFDLSGSLYAEYGALRPLLASLFGGALVGAGCALTFLGGGSSGGVDIIALVLSKHLPRARGSVALFVIDALIILFGLFAIRDIVVCMLGILSALTCALVVDRAKI